PAKTQAALLEAMQERTVTVDGVGHPLSATFTVFATQNPVEFEGTYPLPEAELDRFMAKVLVGYPDSDAEQGVLERTVQGFEADRPATYGVSQVTDATGLERLRGAVEGVRVASQITAYIAGVVRATREAASFTLGASPRAGVALLKAARAAALLDGRDYVIPDDVKRLAAAVLRHRVSLAPELELEGVTPDAPGWACRATPLRPFRWAARPTFFTAGSTAPGARPACGCASCGPTCWGAPRRRAASPCRRSVPRATASPCGRHDAVGGAGVGSRWTRSVRSDWERGATGSTCRGTRPCIPPSSPRASRRRWRGRSGVASRA